MWIALAQAQHELGLDITSEQLDEMSKHVDSINFDAAAAYERELRHDVMAHIHAFGDQCPTARPIIHLGATSCFVGDNTDLIQMRDGMNILRTQMLHLIKVLREVCLKYKDLPTLGFTHYQPAQLTTYAHVLSLTDSLSDSLSDSLTHSLTDSLTLSLALVHCGILYFLGIA
jgi:adenylosuccinate lyase